VSGGHSGAHLQRRPRELREAGREYIEAHWERLFTYRKLKRIRPELPPHMNGTGAMEEN